VQARVDELVQLVPVDRAPTDQNTGADAPADDAPDDTPPDKPDKPADKPKGQDDQ
jgi:hypothetical protein